MHNSLQTPCISWRELEGRTEELAGTFNEQGVSNMLWACARMGLEPGAY
jgi:hypothetical protein